MDDKESQTTYKLREDIASTSHRAEIESMISQKSNSSGLATNLGKYLAQKDDVTYQYYPGTEMDQYDFSSERHTDKTNMVQSVAHLIKGTLGAGVLTMHEAYMHGGLWVSLVFTFIFGYLNYYSMYMLAASAQRMYTQLRIPKMSYPELAEQAAAKGAWLCFRKFSKPFRYTVDFCLFFFMCGTCCIYQILIASTFKQAVETANKDVPDFFYDDLRAYILITSPMLLLLCLIRKFKMLAMFSLLSDVLIALCVLATLYYSLQTGELISKRPVWTNFNSFLKFCGVCIYCTCGVPVCLPVENKMEKPRTFNGALSCAMWIVIIATGMTGLFGYWGWGEACTSPITVHMPINVFTTILHFLLAIMLSITFVVDFWVPFKIIWSYIRSMRRFKTRPNKTLAGWERLYRILLGFLVTCVSISFPNLIPFMAFLSFFFLGLIAFVFPALIDSLITWKEDRENHMRLRPTKNIILIAFGLVLSVSAFYFFFS